MRRSRASCRHGRAARQRRAIGRRPRAAVGPVPPSAQCRTLPCGRLTVLARCLRHRQRISPSAQSAAALAGVCDCAELTAAAEKRLGLAEVRRRASASLTPTRPAAVAAAAAGHNCTAQAGLSRAVPCDCGCAPTEACAPPALLLGRASDCGPRGSRAPALCTAVTPAGRRVQDGRRLAEEELAAKARQVGRTLRVACCTLHVAHRVARCMLRCVLHVALHVAHFYLCALHAARSLLWCASRHCPRRRSTARLCLRVAGSATAVVVGRILCARCRAAGRS